MTAITVAGTDTETLMRQRVRRCVKRLNDDAASGGAVPMDWYNIVDLNNFSVQDPNACALGQIFMGQAVREKALDIVNTRDPEAVPVHWCLPWAVAITYFSPANANANNEWAIDHGVCSDHFLSHEIDYTPTAQYADLTRIWIEEIGNCRVYAATAEGTAIMEESKGDDQ